MCVTNGRSSQSLANGTSSRPFFRATGRSRCDVNVSKKVRAMDWAFSCPYILSLMLPSRRHVMLYLPWLPLWYRVAYVQLELLRRTEMAVLQSRLWGAQSWSRQTSRCHCWVWFLRWLRWLWPKSWKHSLPPQDPIAFEYVCSRTATSASRPSSHTRPVPFGPMSPALCVSSTTNWILRRPSEISSAISSSSSKGQTSPSMLFTDSTATGIERRPCLISGWVTRIEVKIVEFGSLSQQEQTMSVC